MRIVARWRIEVSLLVLAVALVAGAAAARAGVTTRRSHRVAPGDSLWTIAREYRCTVDDLRRANRLDGNTIQPGQRLRIPRCTEEGDKRENSEKRDDSDDPRGDQAPSDEAPGDETAGTNLEAETDLEHVAGTDPEEGAGREEVASTDYEVRELATREETREPVPPWTGDDTDYPTREGPAPDDDLVPVAVPIVGQSIGRPQNGYLVSGKRLPTNPKLYYLRRPERAWGTTYTIDQLVRAIRQVRRRHPRVHPLAIGDLSARHGGRISMHGSHRSGRDADIGFYFRRTPRGYPRAFAVASADNIDFRPTWALLSALCKTASDPSGGVERIYMTYRTQAMFYRLARKYRVPRAQLDAWFQYPHGRRADRGIIRHEPGHEEHIHVRFRCASNDPECR